MFIGITGYAQSGKDTVCDILRAHGIVENRYAFADPIKDTCNALFGWDERHSFGELKEVEQEINVLLINDDKFNAKCTHYGLDKFGMSANDIHNELAKQLLHKLDIYTGILTVSPREVYQVFGTEVCREFLHKNIWVLIAPSQNVAIPDVRFPNESKWVRENGGKLLRVTNRNATPIRAHESESYIESLEVDAEFDNNGTLAELETQVMEYFGISKDSPRLYPFVEGDIQYVESDVFVDRIKTMEDLTDIQTQYGNWNYDPYMHGMANGMILCLAIMRGEELVEYKDAPTEWLRERYANNPPNGFERQMMANDLQKIANELGFDDESQPAGLDCHFGEGCPSTGCDCAS